MRSFDSVPADRPALIAAIKAVQFSPTRFSVGYDEREVDHFLHRVVAGLIDSSTTMPVTPREIRDHAFRQTKFKGGYRIEDVDEFRRTLAEAVQRAV